MQENKTNEKCLAITTYGSKTMEKCFTHLTINPSANLHQAHANMYKYELHKREVLHIAIAIAAKDTLHRHASSAPTTQTRQHNATTQRDSTTRQHTSQYFTTPRTLVYFLPNHQGLTHQARTQTTHSRNVLHPPLHLPDLHLAPTPALRPLHTRHNPQSGPDTLSAPHEKAALQRRGVVRQV
jgi:hypothetical protein